MVALLFVSLTIVRQLRRTISNLARTPASQGSQEHQSTVACVSSFGALIRLIFILSLQSDCSTSRAPLLKHTLPLTTLYLIPSSVSLHLLVSISGFSKAPALYPFPTMESAAPRRQPNLYSLVMFHRAQHDESTPGPRRFQRRLHSHAVH